MTRMLQSSPVTHRLAFALLVLIAAGSATLGAQSPAQRAERRAIELLLDRGQREAAESRARRASDDVTLADVLRRGGNPGEAERLYRAAAARNAPFASSARAALAELLLERGAADSAADAAQQIVNAYDPNGASSDAHVAAGRAYEVLSRRDPGAARNALRAYDAGFAADASHREARLRAGALLLARYNAPEARASFEELLAADSAQPRALLGLAEVLVFDGDRAAPAVVRQALTIDSTLADGHRLLARFALDAERFDSATVHVDRALAFAPHDEAARGLQGAIAWVTGDSATFRAARLAAETRSRQPSTFWRTLADAAVSQRRYREAVTFAQRAVAVAPDDAIARGLLGTTRLRTGEITAGRADLEAAFAADPFNVWFKNTLDLLDDLATYRTVSGPRIDLVAPADQAALLGAYLVPLLEEAYDSLAARYRWTPEDRVRIELYPRHADFSVRSVGMTGLGALGVSFGTVLAMDAPSARERGEFNWGTVAWHELAHTFTLGRSGHRVPRWLSEGLSVFEERRARPAWGGDVSLPFLAAYASDGVRPVSRLADGFLFPRTPNEVQHSYLMASLACEWLAEQYGDSIFVPLLDAFRDGADTPTAFTRVLGLDADSLDARVDRWVRARYAQAFAALTPPRAPGEVAGPFVDAMRAGVQALAGGDSATARVQFRAAHALVPDYPARDGPAAFLARLSLAGGDTTNALTWLAHVTSRDDAAYEENRLEATLRDAVGDTIGAIAAYQRVLWIDPREELVHERLAALATARGDTPTAIRELRARVALAAGDAVAPRFALFQALDAAGQREAAYDALLEVLERAPTFEPALERFLELRGGARP